MKLNNCQILKVEVILNKGPETLTHCTFFYSQKNENISRRPMYYNQGAVALFHDLAMCELKVTYCAHVMQ